MTIPARPSATAQALRERTPSPANRPLARAVGSPSRTLWTIACPEIVLVVNALFILSDETRHVINEMACAGWMVTDCAMMMPATSN